MPKSKASEPVVSANAAPSARKARTQTSAKAPVARAAKHSKAVVEEPVTPAPSVAAPAVVPVAPVPAEPAVAAVSAPAASVKPAVSVKPAASVKTVSHEEIAKLAYCYWADRGYQGGSPEEDWARAERTLLATL